MAAPSLVRAWAILVALSAGTALLSMAHPWQGQQRLVISAGVLILAGLKARLILADYLGLRGSSFWSRLFGLVLGLFLTTAFVLYSLAGST